VYVVQQVVFSRKTSLAEPSFRSSRVRPAGAVDGIHIRQAIPTCMQMNKGLREFPIPGINADRLPRRWVTGSLPPYNERTQCAPCLSIRSSTITLSGRQT
jgi:hypothetical protein